MAESRKHSYRITGMTCATCARMVQRALARVPGVEVASVNLATETVFVLSAPEVEEGALRRAVEAAGYGLLTEVPEDLEAARYRRARGNLLFVLGLTVPLSLAMGAHMMGWHVPFYAPAELLLGGAVVFWGGRSTLRGAWIALVHRHANMDTLIALGALASWTTAALSLAGLPLPSFGAVGAMILALHVLGRFLESRLRDRATREVKALLRLQAQEARVLREGKALLLPLEAVQAGDRVQVLPGERIPVDGRVLEGPSAVDESLVTGESAPVLRAEGDEVTGGSLNLSGVLLLETVRVGEDAFLAQMLRMVREAQGGKVPLQALADRTTLVFVPAVVALALLAALGWLLFPEALEALQSRLPLSGAPGSPAARGLYAFIATLVIACPCALGLATPMALAVAAGEASRRGLLLRDGEAFQTLRGVSVALLDKTGTLTRGEPEVVASTLPPEAAGPVLALEGRSHHPLARAVAGHLQDRGVVPPEGWEQVEETPGEGIRGILEGQTWFVGRPEEPEGHRDLRDRGLTLVEVRRDGDVLGVLGVTDPLREESPGAVRRLEALGLRVVMATGDHESVARRVAREAGIREVHAGVRPEGKLDLVHRFQAEGLRVLMVGDGINDAGALKGADVGVAMGSGLDLALDSADLILVRGGLEGLAEAVLLSRRLVRTVAQNLAGAFLYNLVALPLAMLGVLHPALAEAAMGASSITVILNSLRIRSVRDETKEGNRP